MSVQLPAESGCMCGEVRMRTSATPTMTMACHCTGCPKLSASAFSLSAMMPSAGFEVAKGEPAIGALHGALQYSYCPRCLNWLFTRSAGLDAFVNVRPTMFDVPAWSKPFIETSIATRLPWARTAAQHSFAHYPPPDRYGALMAQYARPAG